MNQSLYNIQKLHPHDVLCGKRSEHEGNKYYRFLVKEVKHDYILAPKNEKPVFARLIVDHIRSLNPPGRFLRGSPRTGLYHDIGDREALTKTRQALREKAPEIEKQLKEQLESCCNEKTIVPITSRDDSKQSSFPSNDSMEPIEFEGSFGCRYSIDDVRDFLEEAMPVYSDTEMTQQGALLSQNELLQQDWLPTYPQNPRRSFYVDSCCSNSCEDSINHSQHSPRQSPYDDKKYFNELNHQRTPSLPASFAMEEVFENEVQLRNSLRNSFTGLRMSLSSLKSSAVSKLLRGSIISFSCEFEFDYDDDNDNDKEYTDEEKSVRSNRRESYHIDIPYQEVFAAQPMKVESIAFAEMTEVPYMDCHDDKSMSQQNAIHDVYDQDPSGGKLLHKRADIPQRRRSSLVVVSFVNAMLD